MTNEAERRVVDLLRKRVMDSRSRLDFSIVEVGFASDQEALDFHEAITALEPSDG